MVFSLICLAVLVLGLDKSQLVVQQTVRFRSSWYVGLLLAANRIHDKLGSRYDISCRYILSFTTK